MKKIKKSFFQMITNIFCRFSGFSTYFKQRDHPASNKIYKQEKESLKKKNFTAKLNTEESPNQIPVMFEQQLYEIFKQRGYSISDDSLNENALVDLILLLNNEITFVQYKGLHEQQLDIDTVARFYDVITTNEAEHGIIITSGNFTHSAINFSLGKSLLLINGLDLQQMINALEPVIPITSKQAEFTGDTTNTTVTETYPDIQAMPELEPLCPICSREMIKRTAKKGKNAGHSFWGCSQFPRCRGVVNL